MAANTPTVNRFLPVLRAGATAYIFPTSQWVDNLALVAGTAKSYTIPTDSASRHASIFRVTASGGPVWLNANGGTATVPVADKTTGDGVVCIPAGVPYWLAQPIAGQPLSFIADAGVVLAIEAWT